jgi:hypothetical protein
MASAEIASLRIRLAADAADVDSGFGAAEKKVDQFAKKFGVSSAVVARAAGVMSGALAGVFSARAVKAAIDQADAIGKMAQSAGISTQSLSGLAHAAELAGISTDELGGILGRFNRSLGEASVLASDAGLALAAMGISARDAATGGARSMDEILGDVADRFAGYADGINKVNLAQDLFGRSGAKLIPLLNQGRGGLEAAREEARKLGIEIGPDFAKRAEEFNDSWAKFSASMRGFANDIGAVVAPALTSMLQKMTEVISKERELGSKMGSWLTSFRDSQTAKAIQEINAELATMLLRREALEQQPTRTAKEELEYRRLAGAIAAARREREDYERTQGLTIEAPLSIGGNAPDTHDLRLRQEQEIRDSQKEAADALAMMTERTDLYNQAVQNLGDPLSEYQSKLLELDRAQKTSAVDADVMAAAHVQAVAKMHADVAAVGSNLTGALAQLFSKNKQFSYANALMSTYESVARALAGPPGVPWSYANAAAALVRGMAQVRAIQQTQPGSTAAPAPTGGGGAASTPAAAPAAPAAPPQMHLLEVHGLNAKGMFSDEMVRELVRKISDFTRDGGRVVVAN